MEAGRKKKKFLGWRNVQSEVYSNGAIWADNRTALGTTVLYASKIKAQKYWSRRIVLVPFIPVVLLLC